jgi:hypothetical protein
MPGRRLPAALLAAGLLLAGCGGGEGDTPGATLPPVTPTASASATAAGPDPQGVPSQARAATAEGAAAFIRLYYERIGESYASLDPTLLEEITDPACEGCQALIGSVAAVRDEGGRVDPYEIQVVDVVVPGLEPGSTSVNAIATVNLGAFVRYDAAGNEVFRDTPAENFVQSIDLRREGDSWRVLAVESR